MYRSCRGNLFSQATSDVDHEARLLPLFGRRVSRPHVSGVAAVAQEPFRFDALNHGQNADPPMHSNILSDQAHAKVSPSRIMAKLTNHLRFWQEVSNAAVGEFSPRVRSMKP